MPLVKIRYTWKCEDRGIQKIKLYKKQSCTKNNNKKTQSFKSGCLKQADSGRKAQKQTTTKVLAHRPRKLGSGSLELGG